MTKICLIIYSDGLSCGAKIKMENVQNRERGVEG